jgi:thymidine phosphorylase
MPHAPLIRPIYADDEGKVTAITTRDLGLAVIELGGGRRVASDKINHAVGLDRLLGKGFRVDFETPLCVVHAASEDDFNRAAVIVKQAYTVGTEGKSWPIVLERMTA